MTFKNRKEAGEKLAEKLIKFKNTEAIVYALPRGGVIVANEIAQKLNLPLDLVITRKIGHPYEPEFAICAIAEDGHRFCNPNEELEVDATWLMKRFKEEQKEAKRRREVYVENRPMLSPKKKTAIIVDDGIATGLTITLAIKEIMHENPTKIIVAVPVAPSDAAKNIEKDVGEFVALIVDKDFAGAIGNYYDDFSEVADDEVVKIMSEYKQNEK
jgi:putative phosphoribosyl transferase